MFIYQLFLFIHPMNWFWFINYSFQLKLSKLEERYVMYWLGDQVQRLISESFAILQERSDSLICNEHVVLYWYVMYRFWCMNKVSSALECYDTI